MPKPSKPLPLSVKAAWETFIDGVRKHERVHGADIEDMVRQIEATSVGLSVPDDPKCQKVRAELQKRLAALSAAQRQKSRDFDAVELGAGGACPSPDPRPGQQQVDGGRCPRPMHFAGGWIFRRGWDHMAACVRPWGGDLPQMTDRVDDPGSGGRPALAGRRVRPCCRTAAIVLVESYRSQLTAISPDGRAERFAYTAGAPNACVLGSDGLLYVCQNGGTTGPWRAAEMTVPSIQRVAEGGKPDILLTRRRGHRAQRPERSGVCQPTGA